MEESARLVIDGRGFKVPCHEEGIFTGGTLFDHVTPEMRIYTGRDFCANACRRPFEGFFQSSAADQRSLVRESAASRAARLQRGGDVRPPDRNGRGGHQRADSGTAGMAFNPATEHAPCAWLTSNGRPRSCARSAIQMNVCAVGVPSCSRSENLVHCHSVPKKKAQRAAIRTFVRPLFAFFSGSYTSRTPVLRNGWVGGRQRNG
ncbi:hypothetical protein SAMN05444172_2384 [Burkholderia sp. GAS332]|nr:hypothetical protein SAMN05444172_2384 [Burkholderia sp. GAS332]